MLKTEWRKLHLKTMPYLCSRWTSPFMCGDPHTQVARHLHPNPHSHTHSHARTRTHTSLLSSSGSTACETKPPLVMTEVLPSHSHACTHIPTSTCTHHTHTTTHARTPLSLSVFFRINSSWKAVPTGNDRHPPFMLSNSHMRTPPTHTHTHTSLALYIFQDQPLVERSPQRRRPASSLHTGLLSVLPRSGTAQPPSGPRL